MFSSSSFGRTSPSLKAPQSSTSSKETPVRSSVSASPPLSVSSSASSTSTRDSSIKSNALVINVFDNTKRFQNARHFTRPILSNTQRSKQTSPSSNPPGSSHNLQATRNEDTSNDSHIESVGEKDSQVTADESTPVASDLSGLKARPRAALTRSFDVNGSGDAGLEETEMNENHRDEDERDLVEGGFALRVARGVNLHRSVQLPESKMDLRDSDPVDSVGEDVRDIVESVIVEWRRLHSVQGTPFRDSITYIKSQIQALMDYEDSQYPESSSEMNEVDDMQPPSPTPTHGLHWQEWKSRIDNFRRTSFHITRDTNEKEIDADLTPKSINAELAHENKLSPKAASEAPTESSQATITRSNSNAGFFNWKKHSESSAAMHSAMEDLQAQKIKYQSENMELKETIEYLESSIKQKTERCQILEQANATLVGEIEELTKSLFEEANGMVSHANRAAHEKDYENNLLKIKVAQQEQTIKLLEHELEYEKSRIYHKSLAYMTDKFRDVRLSTQPTEQYHNSSSEDASSLANLDMWPELSSELLLKEFDEFTRPSSTIPRKIDDCAFIKRIIYEDVEPSIEFVSKNGLKKDILSAIKSKTIEFKVMRGPELFHASEQPSTPKTPHSADDGTSKQSILGKSLNFMMHRENSTIPCCHLCQHTSPLNCKVRLGSHEKWMTIDKYCYEKLYSAYRLYLLCCQVFEGDARPVLEIFRQIATERTRAFFARIAPPLIDTRPKLLSSPPSK